jgi:predicted nucleic acid-binding Zn ribbon protein
MSADSLRRKVIAEWRGLPEPPTKADRCASVGALLEKLMPKLGLKDRMSEAQILDAWKEIVGDFLAQHSIPSGLHSGVLTIQVIQPTVRYELDRTWKPEILKKLQARFGARIVREIRFRL